MSKSKEVGTPIFEDCYTVFKRMTPPSMMKQMRDANLIPEDIWSTEYRNAQQRYRYLNNRVPIVVYFENEYRFTYYES